MRTDSMRCNTAAGFDQEVQFEPCPRIAQPIPVPLGSAGALPVGGRVPFPIEFRTQIDLQRRAVAPGTHRSMCAGRPLLREEPLAPDPIPPRRQASGIPSTLE